MYIERLIISGFKSYREHTVIDGFDRYFNAITGPNGSGKSNILDAICFVLGIQNLSLVRAQGGLQELIYKQGQSGVTKASVEVVFNNEDKNASPVGYTQFDHITVCRQITSGSSSKYFINDHPANATRVHNLFHSVQLNVNNPHFLIMQGKITQVLNMKPQEILGLIEEAAGIKMYEDKKEDSKRILDRKQKQLEEIERIFQDELKPNLERLKKERDEYDTWVSIRSDVERMHRWVVAYNYKETDRALKEGIKLIREEKEKKEKLEENIKDIGDKINQKKDQISVLTTQKEDTEKGKYVKLEKKIAQLKKDVTLNETLIQQSELEIKRLKKKKEAAEKQAISLEESLKNKKEEKEKIANEDSEDNEKFLEAQQKINHIESRIKDINIGIADEGKDMSLSDEVEEQKRILRDCEVEIKRIEKNAPYLRGRKVELERVIRDAEHELDELNESIQKCTSTIDQINSELRRLNFDPNLEEQLINDQRNLNQIITEKRDQINSLDRELGFLEFRPHRPQGITEIYGPLVRLFKVKDEFNNEYNLALQKTAGGKLFNIVVANENDASLLIKHGHLNKRYGFIPLTKIDGRTISKDAINKAGRIANGRDANFALDVIQFDPRFEQAMKFAFGQSFLCNNKDTAKDLAFNQSTMIRSITTDGSVYDPNGVVSGGFTQNDDARNSVILKVAIQERLISELRQYEAQLDDVTKQLMNMEHDSRLYRQLKNDLDIAEHQLQSQNQRKSSSTYEEARANLERVNQEIEDNQAKIHECHENKKVAERKLQELTKELNEWNSQKDSKIRALEDELAEARKEFDDIRNLKADKESTLEQIDSDIEFISKDITKANSEIAEYENNIQTTTDKKAKISDKFDELKNELKNTEEAFNELKKDLSEKKDTLAKYIKEENELQQKLTKKKIKLTKTENSIETLTKRHDSAKSDLQKMKEDNPWIEQEERFFGVPHTDFDFKEYEPDDANEKLESLIKQQQELEGRVNKRVISQYERAENEYLSLVDKKKTVEEEKKKIEEVIEELEEKKREAITSTHNKVTQDLQDIVSQVLPGTTAKLVPPENMSVFEGLELIVSFNNLQKSLTELSGGQRSLIALGLVLALLKFKPAPVYILDEVDSALDLNHTQNIGKMLRKSFQKAQFIVVSLKEGMWNNANVVFRTSFKDSNSQVKRTENEPL